MLTILVPDQGDDETSAAIERMLGYITDEQGTVDGIASDSPWGRRRLAYTIRHEGVDYRDGHYVLVYFTAMPSAISEIERELKLDTNVIRYLLLTHDPQMGEKIDEAAIEAENGDDAPVASTETQAEVTATEMTQPPAGEVSAETTEVPTEAAVPVEEAPVEAAEAPVEEVVAETIEAPAEEVAAEETTSVGAQAEDDVTVGDVAADEAATEDAATEAVTEESAADGEVEESTEE
jgi:small subunit ribosomal protein S6